MLKRVILLMLLLAGCADSSGGMPDVASPVALPTVDPADVGMVEAQANYDLYCTHCHGADGSGQPTGGGPGTVAMTEGLGYHAIPLHNAEGHTWRHPDQLLFEIIKYGAENPLNLYVMAPHGENLNDDEIWGVIAYMKRFWTDEQRAYQTQLTEQFDERRPNWEQYHLDAYADDLATE